MSRVTRVRPPTGSTSKRSLPPEPFICRKSVPALALDDVVAVARAPGEGVEAAAHERDVDVGAARDLSSLEEPMIVSWPAPPLQDRLQRVAVEPGRVDRVVAVAGVDRELGAALGVDEVDRRRAAR